VLSVREHIVPLRMAGLSASSSSLYSLHLQKFSFPHQLLASAQTRWLRFRKCWLINTDALNLNSWSVSSYLRCILL